MQRYFALDEKLTLEESDYFHIKNVMRMRNGDQIEVVYNETIYLCEVNPSKKELTILDKYTNKFEGPKVIVAFSLLKEQKLDYLFQKATEVGCFGFIPLSTTRSIIKIDAKKIESKINRWKKIVKEASEQSFRNNMPVIYDLCNINELSRKEFDNSLKLLCTLNEKTENIKKVLAKNNKYDKIIIVIGPEGGFDPLEEKKLIENGFISISLGNTVLRAETAPVAALSMINYEFMR